MVIDREKLFALLSIPAYRALVDATEMAVSRGMASVGLQAWVAAMIEYEGTALAALLNRIGADPGIVRRELSRLAVAGSGRGNGEVDLSPEIDRAVERALVFANSVRESALIDTASVLLAALGDPGLQRLIGRCAPELGELGCESDIEVVNTLCEGLPREESRSDLVIERAAIGVASNELDQATSLLDQYTDDMTAAARRDELDPVVGRSHEVRQLLDILLRRRQNNPLLIGEAGVGKTAVVECLAQMIADDEVPEKLRGARLLSLDLARLQGGASMRGEFEGRLKSVVDEVRASPTPILLFCDEAHTLIGAGGDEGTGDAVNLLKPMLARGELRMIAATTWSEYKQYMEQDAALARRFQNVFVDEPEDEVAIDMLRALAEKFLNHHGVLLSDCAIRAAVQLSRRHMPSRQLPDKAVSLLDTACARVALAAHVETAELRDAIDRAHALELEIGSLTRSAPLSPSLSEVLAFREVELARVRDQLHSYRETRHAHLETSERVAALTRKAYAGEGDDGELSELMQQLRKASWVGPWVDETVVARVLADWTGIPVDKVLDDEAEAVVRLHDQVERVVFGQSGAISRIVDAVQVNRAGMGDPEKPIGIFLLAGPTGTGKTESAHALAEAAFGGSHNLLKFNMTEFQEAHTVSVLKGAPPGYVGYGKGGILTEGVRKRPYSVLLLDEFDKAHRDVQDLFYDAFDKGLMEDVEGRIISLRNSLILLSTNIGSQYLVQQLADDPDTSDAHLDQIAAQALIKSGMSPALVGRMQVLAFRPLNTEVLHRIARKSLERVISRSAEAGLAFSYDEGVVEWMAVSLGDGASGRETQQLLERTLVRDISRELLARRSVGSTLEQARASIEAGRLRLVFLPAIESGVRSMDACVLDTGHVPTTAQADKV